ncbi:MAG: glycosyltransferase family 4 protein [Candidatus Omnitrophica bacterium]|nr:glycosyltransferase family 4 protein [Candidatus Omnitrophota bacterium]
MKVLIFAKHMNIGGIGMYSLNLARELGKNGLTVEIASSGGGLEKDIRDSGITHHSLDINSKNEFGIMMLRSLAPFRKLCVERGFDIVHSQDRMTQIIADLSGRLTGIPYVTTCHGFFKARRLSRRIFPAWGRKVIAISRNVEKHLILDFKVDPGKVRQVYNGIDTARFSPDKKVKDDEVISMTGLSRGKKVIGNVGRFSAVKGQRYLIEAFAELIGKGYDCQLFCLGDNGGEREKLEELAGQLGVKDNMVLLSESVFPLEKYLAIMDVFCLPSVQEGLGLALLEAMSMGLPAVASNVGGIPEIIDDGETGLLVRPADPVDLANAVSRYLDDGALLQRVCRNAPGKVSRDFSFDKFAKGILKVYEEVLAGV